MPSPVRTTAPGLGRLRGLPDVAKGYILAFAATACVALNFVTAKYALRAYPAHVFVPLWFGAATAYALIYIVLRRKTTPWGQVGRHWKAFALVAGTTAAMAVAHFWGLSVTDPTVASLISRAAIPASIILGIGFLGERPTRLEAVGIFVCLVGLSIVFYSGRSIQELMGPVALLFAAVLYALSQMFVRQVAGEVDPILMAGARTFGGALLVLIVVVAAGQFHLPWAPTHLIVLLVGAFFGPFLAHVLLFKALAHLELSRAGTVQASQPLFVAVYAWVFLRMLPGLQQIIGGLVIIAGLLIIMTRARAVAVPNGQTGG